jgi:hypothetical protein
MSDILRFRSNFGTLVRLHSGAHSSLCRRTPNICRRHDMKCRHLAASHLLKRPVIVPSLPLLLFPVARNHAPFQERRHHLVFHQVQGRKRLRSGLNDDPSPLQVGHTPVPKQCWHFGSSSLRCVFVPVPKHSLHFPLPPQSSHLYSIGLLLSAQASPHELLFGLRFSHRSYGALAF